MRWVMQLLIAMFAFASTAHAKLQTVVIAHAANFSNVSTSAINPYNNAVSNGLEFAVSEATAQLKAKSLEIKIQNFDYGNSEVKAISAANEIVNSSAVAAIGFYESGQSLLGSPILEKEKVALISPMSSATRLFGQSAYFHPMSFSNEKMGSILANFAKAEFKAKKVLIVTAADCAYCMDLSKAFRKTADSLKIVVTEKLVLNETADFSSLDQSIANQKYDAVLIPNHELTSARIIAHLLKNGVHAPYLGGDGWGNAAGSGFFRIVEDPTFRGYCIGHWHPNMTTETGRRFIRDWTKKYGKAPTADSAMAYDSMRLLLLAILNSETVARESVQSSLQGIKHYDGATGDLFFKTPGDAPVKAVVILKSDLRAKSFSPAKFFEAKE